MVDIISELKEKNNEVISLHEVITTLQKNSPEATLGQIAEWLIIQLVNVPGAPDMGLLSVGGGLEPIPPSWVNYQGGDYYSLNELLLTLYREQDYWPGEIPF